MEQTLNSYIVIEPFELERLQELKIDKRMNEHVKLTFKGIVPESRKDSYVQMADAQTEIVVKEVDEQGKRVTLFHGMILDVEIYMAQGVYFISVDAVSNTYKLDLQPVDRSFQQIGLAYRSLMNQVIGAYPQADLIDYASNGSSLESMICSTRKAIGNSSSGSLRIFIWGLSPRPWMSGSCVMSGCLSSAAKAS
ncbi:hypothetical protein HMSSN036_66920 [Paenibacillus macerans]|nr:hypothetical protein HMSSN036_66920 [Paenibacillus macerans]